MVHPLVAGEELRPVRKPVQTCFSPEVSESPESVPGQIGGIILVDRFSPSGMRVIMGQKLEQYISPGFTHHSAISRIFLRNSSPTKA